MAIPAMEFSLHIENPSTYRYFTYISYNVGKVIDKDANLTFNLRTSTQL
jgi:hypothetical protein